MLKVFLIEINFNENQNLKKNIIEFALTLMTSHCVIQPYKIVKINFHVDCWSWYSVFKIEPQNVLALQIYQRLIPTIFYTQEVVPL